MKSVHKKQTSEGYTVTATSYDTHEPQDSTTHQSPLKAVLGQRNFQLLWFGEAISLIGDQFHMIALPWLVLQMTGDAFAMGAVLALGGIPRALFMLLGGAVTDRFSPRAVMLASNLARMVLVGLLAVLVLTGALEVWMLYVFSLLAGLAGAFFFPAQNAIVPQVVDKAYLQTGNAIISGTAQLSLFGGPVLAGALIALLSGEVTTGNVAAGTAGIGIAFGIDTLTFLVSALSLWWLRLTHVNPAQAGDTGTMFSAIREGLAYVWDDIKLRTIFIIIAVSNLLVVGPMSIGIPVLADTRFSEGAAAFGILMSAYGGGSLLGTILAGVLPRPPARVLGSVLFVIYSSMGIGIALLGLTTTTPIAALVTLAMGVGQGYVVILFITWLQGRTPQALLGRMMSLLMFSTNGLVPVSHSLTGALIDLNPVALFTIFGGLMAVMSLVAALNPNTRELEAVAVG